MVTIEGKNFGSILSSFGEEDREENSDIKIFFLKDSDDNGVAVPCEEIAHYHNPTQLFCIMRLPFPERYSHYASRVFINGNEANLHCGCRTCEYTCKLYVNQWTSDVINDLVGGNLVAASTAQWTEWYSYAENEDRAKNK